MRGKIVERKKILQGNAVEDDNSNTVEAEDLYLVVRS